MVLAPRSITPSSEGDQSICGPLALDVRRRTDHVHEVVDPFLGASTADLHDEHSPQRFVHVVDHPPKGSAPEVPEPSESRRLAGVPLRRR